MTKTPPGAIVTDFQKAKAGDVFDTAGGAQYRFVLLSQAPEWRGDAWSIRGSRWMASKQSFSKNGLRMRCAGPRPISNTEADAYIARLAAADIAAGIE